MKYYVNVIFVLLDRTFFCWRDTKTFRRHFGQISVVDAVMAHSADERYLWVALLVRRSLTDSGDAASASRTDA